MTFTVLMCEYILISMIFGFIPVFLQTPGDSTLPAPIETATLQLSLIPIPKEICTEGNSIACSIIGASSWRGGSEMYPLVELDRELTPKKIFIELLGTRMWHAFAYLANQRLRMPTPVNVAELVVEFVNLHHSVVFDAYRLNAKGYRITSLWQDGQIMGLYWGELRANIVKTDAPCDYIISPLREGPGEAFEISAIGRGLDQPGYDHTHLFADSRPCLSSARESSVCVYLVQTCGRSPGSSETKPREMNSKDET